MQTLRVADNYIATPARVTIGHIQLRDVLTCPRKGGIVYYPSNRTIVEHNLPAEESDVVAQLSFMPNSLATFSLPDTDDMLLAAGGQDAELFLSYHGLDGPALWSTELKLKSASTNNSIILRTLDVTSSHQSAVEPRMIVSNHDRTVRVFDIATRKEGSDSSLQRLSMAGKLRLDVPVNHSSISPDGHTLLSVGESRDIYIHTISGSSSITFTAVDKLSIAPYVPMGSLYAPPPSVRSSKVPLAYALSSSAFSADGSKFVVGSEEGAVVVFDTRSTRPLKVIHTDRSRSSSAKHNATGRASGWLYESSSDGSRPSWTRPGWGVSNVRFSPSGAGQELLVFTEHTSMLHLVDARTFEGEEILSIPNPNDSRNSSPTPDPSIHASDDMMQVDPPDLEDPSPLGVHLAGICFDPSGRSLYAASATGIFRWTSLFQETPSADDKAESETSDDSDDTLEDLLTDICWTCNSKYVPVSDNSKAAENVKCCSKGCTAAAQHIMTLLERALESNDNHYPMLKLQEREAQNALNIMQKLVENAHEHRRNIRRLIMKLSLNCDKLPASLFLQGVTCLVPESYNSGGYADIYRGEYDDHIVALKRLRIFQTIEESKRLELKKTFYHESLIWRNLDHQHVLPFLGVVDGILPRSLCMVLPWMPNGNIRHWIDHLKTSKYPANLLERDTLQWLKEIALGLAYLHGEEIVHGDLRGANILIDENLNVRLADFGLAVFAEAESNNYASVRGGNARWLAPELIYPEIFGTSSRPTYASDIFAFACASIEIYTGKAPYAEIKDGQILARVPYGFRPSRPSSPEWDSLDDLWTLWEICWNQSPADRPSADMLADKAPTPVASISMAYGTQKRDLFPEASIDMPSNHSEPISSPLPTTQNRQLSPPSFEDLPRTPRTPLSLLRSLAEARTSEEHALPQDEAGISTAVYFIAPSSFIPPTMPDHDSTHPSSMLTDSSNTGAGSDMLGTGMPLTRAEVAQISASSSNNPPPQYLSPDVGSSVAVPHQIVPDSNERPPLQVFHPFFSPVLSAPIPPSHTALFPDQPVDLHGSRAISSIAAGEHHQRATSGSRERSPIGTQGSAASSARAGPYTLSIPRRSAFSSVSSHMLLNADAASADAVNMDSSTSTNLLGAGFGDDPGAGGADMTAMTPVAKPIVNTASNADASQKRRRQEPNYVCPVPGCGSRFTRHFNLKGHLRSHAEEKPFQCKWPGCNKGFARQHDCKRHENLHLNIRPIPCEGCKKVFARTDALNRHLRSEGGEECRKLLQITAATSESPRVEETVPKL